MSLCLVDSSPVGLHFKHIRVFQYPREHFFFQFEKVRMFPERLRGGKMKDLSCRLTLSSIFPNCHELTYPVRGFRVTLAMNSAPSASLKKGLRFVFLHKTYRKMQSADKHQAFDDDEPAKVHSGKRIGKSQ